MIPGRSGHDAYAALGDAVKRGDVAETRRLLAAEPSLRHRIDEPRRDLSFGSTLLLNAVSQRNLDLADALLEAGADINVRSGWWAGGFGVLDTCAMDLAPALISRGATVGPYQAARLGMVDALREMLARDPALVHARGGDGQTPLHVAANVGIARLLVEAGADIDALDVDHESTPCQYLIRERQDVVRYLLVRTAYAGRLAPDGAWLSFRTSITGEPQLWTVARVSEWPEQRTFGRSVTFHDVSPSGEWIAYGTDRGGNEREGFYLIRPDGTAERELLAPSEAFRQFGGFSRDGRRIAYATTDGETDRLQPCGRHAAGTGPDGL